MAGTKRLAVTGPWHGQVIEPETDNYTTVTWRATGAAALGLDAPEPVPYEAQAYPVPLVAGIARMPLLVPVGIMPTAPEVLDALVLAVFGEVQG
jgi:hypothetical protein